MRPFLCLCASFLALNAAFAAQAQKAKAPTGNFTYSASKLSYSNSGVRLDGTAAKPARIKSGELEVVAQAIAFDLKGNSISQVRAVGGVSLKVNLSPKNGPGEKVRVESRSASATLTTANRELVLKTNLSGFYQIGDGPKNTLSGEEATISYAGNNLSALISGGAQGVVFNVPAESLGQPGALGPLKVTAKSARYDQNAGRIVLSGNARVVSIGGANDFDVSAPSMVVSRKGNGTLDTLTTTGRTKVKFDLPPEPGAASANGVGTPTHVEVSADGAVVERATLKGTFNGNVKGFYRLQSAGTAPRNFDFSGDKAVVSYNGSGNAQTGLNVEVTNASIESPSFEFDF